MIKTTIYFFKDGYGPKESLPVEDNYDVDLHLLPSVGSEFTFQSYDTAINPDTHKVERRRVSITGRVVYSNQLIMDDGTQYVKLSVQANKIEYGKFQPVPIDSYNVICKTAIGDMSVKAYLLELLYQLWDRGPEFFNTGSPFGYAEWQQEVYDALLESGHIKQTDGWREHKAFVLNMIRKNLWRN